MPARDPGWEILGLGGNEGVVSLALGERQGAQSTPSLAPLPAPPPPRAIS